MSDGAEAPSSADPPRKFRAVLSYDGTAWHGFQLQRGQPTVQAELERALLAITGHAARVNGAGRTDQGVHALGQVIDFSIATRLDPDRLRLAWNHHLDPSVRVHRVEPCEEDFSSRFSAIWRLYHYRLERETTPFSRARAYAPRQWPDLERMNRALAPLLGEWDFFGFTTQTAGPYGCYLSEARAEPTESGARLILRSNRFLYHMARRITAVALEIGCGQAPEDAAARILHERDRAGVKRMAPAHGLYLMGVGYTPTWPAEPLLHTAADVPPVAAGAFERPERRQGAR